jgi:hypothetical protein
MVAAPPGGFYPGSDAADAGDPFSDELVGGGTQASSSAALPRTNTVRGPETPRAGGQSLEQSAAAALARVVLASPAKDSHHWGSSLCGVK